MIIWDLHIFQNGYGFLRDKIVRDLKTPEQPHDENADDSKRFEALVKEKEATSREDLELGQMELCDLPLESNIPYRVSTGLLVLAFFVVTMTVIATIRAVCHNKLPNLFIFFSNIFFASTILYG